MHKNRWKKSRYGAVKTVLGVRVKCTVARKGEQGIRRGGED